MMGDNQSRPSPKELEQLSAYLESRNRREEPSPGEPGFPTGFPGKLLKLAESIQPDPEFAARLERELHQAARSAVKIPPQGRLSALWQSLSHPERKPAMKRLIAYALIGTLLLVIMWISIPSLLPSSTPTQVVEVAPPTKTPAPTPSSSLTPAVTTPTSQPPVAINFTPQPIPNQPPSLPPLVDALGVGYGGYGAGNLPQDVPLQLQTELPSSPADVTAYYRLENTPLTVEQAQQIASQWGLVAQFYMPGWMASVTPDQTERSYVAVESMKNLSMWNSELLYTDLAIFAIYGGHQYPQLDLPPSNVAIDTATQFLIDRGFLNYPYQVNLSQYDYGLVNFYRLLDDLPITYQAASVKLDSHGEVGSTWVNRDDYQSVGTYPVVSAEDAWNILVAGEPRDQISISYYPLHDGNPQYWGRVYAPGQLAHLFGAPTFLLAADGISSPYVQLNNLVLVGDISGLSEYLRAQGYIHAWGEVQEVDGTHQLQLAGWEPFDEFSGYFDGVVRRTAAGDFLELPDGNQLSLPDLPADVPADIPLYAQGGLVGDTLEWFTLQVHPSAESLSPADLSQAQAVIDTVELVYLAPGLSNPSPDSAFDPSYHMLIPVWSFSGHLTDAGDMELAYRAYVQAVANP